MSAAAKLAASPASPPLYPFRGTWPRIHPSAFVAPTASVIGDVEVGEGSGIWYGCVLRGDSNIIRVGKRTNLQDGTIVHVNRKTFAAIIGDDVSVGHAAIVHACTLKDRAFVGMGATILDGCVIEEGGMLGAGGLLPPGKRIGPNELWIGSPAHLVRIMSAEERAGWDETAIHYAELAGEHRRSLGEIGS